MQYLPNTFLQINLAGALVCWSLLAFIRLHWKKISYAFTPIDDQWTLSARDGQVFEEVEVVAVEQGEVIFKHRVGEERLALKNFTADSRARIERGFQSANPADSKRPALVPGLSAE